MLMQPVPEGLGFLPSPESYISVEALKRSDDAEMLEMMWRA